MSDVYILQKDLPDYKAGEIFRWNQFGEIYCAGNTDKNGQVGKWPASYVENNPEWFKRDQTEEIESAKQLLKENGYVVSEYLNQPSGNQVVRVPKNDIPQSVEEKAFTKEINDSNKWTLPSFTMIELKECWMQAQMRNMSFNDWLEKRFPNIKFNF